MNMDEMNEIDKFLMEDNEEDEPPDFSNLKVAPDVIEKYLQLESKRSNANGIGKVSSRNNLLIAAESKLKSANNKDELI
jgi:hypothetical protein